MHAGNVISSAVGDAECHPRFAVRSKCEPINTLAVWLLWPPSLSPMYYLKQWSKTLCPTTSLRSSLSLSAPLDGRLLQVCIPVIQSCVHLIHVSLHPDHHIRSPNLDAVTP